MYVESLKKIKTVSILLKINTAVNKSAEPWASIDNNWKKTKRPKNSIIMLNTIFTLRNWTQAIHIFSVKIKSKLIIFQNEHF